MYNILIAFYFLIMVMNDLFSELNEKQSEAVMATSGPVLVLAGAGSGKTKTLTHRIAYLISEKNISPSSILAVTFTNKAATEMRSRSFEVLKKCADRNCFQKYFNSKPPTIGTFHSVCASILRDNAEFLGFKKSFAIYDSQDQKSAMKSVMRDAGISIKDANPSSILSMISRAKNDLLSPQDMENKSRGPMEKLASELYYSYQSFLRSSGAMDFDDLLLNCVSLFKTNPEILSRYRNLWQYLMIDEYQDTNKVQYEWAYLLAGEAKNIFVVGDDWQGIYSWRGASIRNILEFEKDFEGAKVIFLEQNYRSVEPIVELGNLIISSNSAQMKKKLWTQNKSDFLPEAWLVADESREAEKILEKIAQIENPSETEIDFSSNKNASPYDHELEYDYESEGGHGKGILDIIMGSFSKNSKNLSQDADKNSFGKPYSFQNLSKKSSIISLGKRKINWNDYAVLYRTNAQSRAIEEVMLKYSIPYRIVGGIRFYERKEIKDVLAYLKLLVNPNDLVSAARIINEPPRGIGDKTLAEAIKISSERNEDFLTACSRIENHSKISAQRLLNLKSFAMIFEKIRQGFQDLTVFEIIDFILNESGYFDYLKNGAKLSGNSDEQDRIDNIQELKTASKKFDHLRGEEAVLAFLEDVALVSDVDFYSPEKGQALTLMTLHSAKGLEFETVFLVGVEEGLLPHSNSLADPFQLEEERRLCYVGVTRAKKRLYLIYAARRLARGSVMNNIPSRFLSELGDEHIVFFEEENW